MNTKGVSALELMDKIKEVKEHPNFFAMDNVNGEIQVTYKYSYQGEPNAFHYTTVTL